VNLLKDSEGRIDLELPIKGSLDDPQFDVSALIGTFVSSLLKKALTAPFSLLAAAFGGDGGAQKPGGPGSDNDLAFVAFKPGTSEMDPSQQAKLDRMSKALQQRPGLKLEMAGHFDPQADRAAIREQRIREAYASQFPKPKEGEPAPTLEQMQEKLAEKVTVDDEALSALAARRAEGVKVYLTAKGGLPAERIMVAGSDAGDISTRVSRVDFTLK
jgi:outer membrane protein OmpA-like peptidoglycan-associated protein